MNSWLISQLRRIRRSVETTLQYSGKSGMVRRYFFTNGFDGAMSMLGIVLGTSLFGGANTLTVATAGLGASLAMFISGFMGTYVTESAENKRRIRELNEVMLTDMEGTVVGESGRVGAIVAGLLQGLGALIFAVAVLTPYLVSIHLPPLAEHALPASLASGLFVLFVLGLALGRLTRQGILITGLKMAAVGGVTSVLIILIDLVL
ncbi:MAG: hypothetical protein QXI97_06305 [Nitrososphaerota archaeon]